MTKDVTKKTYYSFSKALERVKVCLAGMTAERRIVRQPVLSPSRISRRAFLLPITGLLIGGFILTTSFNARAEIDNKDKKTEIESVVNNNMVEKFLKSSKVKETNKALDTLKTEYENKVNSYAKTFTSELGTFTTAYGCKTKTNATVLAEKILSEAASKESRRYSWVSHVESIAATCTKKGEAGYKEALEKMMNNAIKLESLRQEFQNIYRKTSGTVYEYKYCAKYKAGGKECATYATFQFLFDSDTGTLESLTGASQGCVPLPFKLSEAKSCLFCPLFDVIYKAVNTAATAAYSKLAKPMSTLVAIGLAIWIAFMVLQNVSSMTKQDAPKFLTDLFRNSFKVIIIFFMLRYSFLVYEYIIGPLLKTGFEFGISFLNKTGPLKNCSLDTSGGNIKGVMPSYLYSNLMCFIKGVQMELAASQAIGSSLMCVAQNQALGNLGPIARVMPDFSMLIQGALIYIISFILSLAFGFYLIDATVQLGIFGMLLPFLLLCYPFKVTNGYFQTGVKVFMNSWFVYVFMGLVVNISLQLIGQGLTGGRGGFGEVEAAINGNNIAKLQELLNIGFSGFLILVACCIFGIKIMMQTESLADKFSGGLGLDMGAKIGGTAYSGATGIAMAGLSLGKNVASGAAHMKVFGEKGNEKSLADFWQAGKSSVKRGMTNAVAGSFRFAGKATAKTAKALSAPIRLPVQFAINKMRGSSRRNPSE